MDNWTEIVEQNWTSDFFSCSGPYFIATSFTYMIITFLSFITTLIIMVELLKRTCKRWKNSSASSGSSPTEVFLLQINLIDVCNAIALLLYLLRKLGVSHVGVYTLFLHHPTTTAEPLFLLGICGSIYCAVVHPVTYMALKNARRCRWMFITLVWLYALIMEVVCYSYKLVLFHPVYMLSWYISLPAIVFFNVCTLRTLDSSGPENGSQGPNPAKKKAFQIVLSILVAILVYTVPQGCYIIYRFLEPTNLYWFECFESQMALILLCLGQIVLPGIFLYSVGKVGA